MTERYDTMKADALRRAIRIRDESIELLRRECENMSEACEYNIRQISILIGEKERLKDEKREVERRLIRLRKFLQVSDDELNPEEQERYDRDMAAVKLKKDVYGIRENELVPIEATTLRMSAV